jgi:hypothetical protein
MVNMKPGKKPGIRSPFSKMAVPSMDERAIGPLTGVKYLYKCSLISSLATPVCMGLNPKEDMLPRKDKKNRMHHPA